MAIQQKVLVLGASRYSFTQDGSKEVIEGTKVHYISLDNESKENQIGHTPQVANLPYDYFDNIGNVPAVYDMHVGLDLTKKKPALKVEGFLFESDIEFASL